MELAILSQLVSARDVDVGSCRLASTEGVLEGDEHVASSSNYDDGRYS